MSLYKIAPAIFVAFVESMPNYLMLNPSVLTCENLLFCFGGAIRYGTTDNFLLLSLDKGVARRYEPGGVERADVLGATGRRGAVDEDEKISHDRSNRSVSRVFKAEKQCEKVCRS